MKNALVYITDGNNSDQIQFSMSTLFKKCNTSKFDIFVISNSIECVNKFQNKINFIQSNFNNTKYLPIPNGAPVSHTTTLERLFIPSYDQLKKYDKILYIDCDTEFFSDISIIFDENFDESEIIGVCEGINSYHFHSCLKKYSGDGYSGFFNSNANGPYINAGVILINNKKLQSEDYQSRISKIISIYEKHPFACVDQDIINMFFKIKLIDSKFNTFGCENIDLISDKILVHYIGNGAKEKLKQRISMEKTI